MIPDTGSDIVIGKPDFIVNFTIKTTINKKLLPK